MDRRIVFILVFGITLISTLLVAGVCLLTHQKWIYTVLYSLATMWIMGIISQLLLQNLYHSIVKPIEEKKLEQKLSEAKQEINLEDVEEIDEASHLQQMLARKGKDKSSPTAPTDEPKIGSKVERTG